MIKLEAKELADKIYGDVVALEITQEKAQRIKIACLVASNIKERTNDAVWQYVINDLRDR